MLGKLSSHMQKAETGSLLTFYSKINCKWIKDLNISPYTIKTLEENLGNILPTEWEKQFVNYPSGNGQISRIYKELKQIYKKKETPSKSGQRIWTDIFQMKTFIQPTNMKKCSSSLVTREMQIKTTFRYHLFQLEWWSLNNLKTADAGEDVEKQ